MNWMATFGCIVAGVILEISSMASANYLGLLFGGLAIYIGMESLR